MPLDGTIFVDPFALAELLEATGPVTVPVLGRTLVADGVVEFLTNQAYSIYEGGAVRKEALGLAARAILRRFLTVAPAEAALRSLVDAASGGHIVLHAADPEVQAAFELAGVAGELGGTEGDFLGVFASNAAGNKVDYYVDRRIRYEVTLGAGGGATLGPRSTSRTTGRPMPTPVSCSARTRGPAWVPATACPGSRCTARGTVGSRA